MSNDSKRRITYDGEIHKCPNCGEVINSFVSICPACGFELNGKNVASSLLAFIEKVNECDKRIANTPHSKTGWTSWSKSKRVWWVVLNVLFLCIPLVIYLVWPLVRIKATPKLSTEEKQMVSLIENFPFPNDRESILAALVYTKEKIDFISKEKANRKSAYWMRLWCAKAEQLKQKADMLFPNDVIAKQSYIEILNDKNRVNKEIKIKAILGLAVLIAVIIFAAVRYDVTDRVGITNDTDYSATFEWQTNGLFAYLPQPETNYGKITSETEKQIQIELYQITPSQFDKYVKSCREAGYTADVTKNDSVFYADNAEGLDLNLFYYADDEMLKISLDSYSVDEESSNEIVDTLPITPEFPIESAPTIGFEEGTYEVLNVKNFTFDIPNYWSEEGSKNEYLQYYAEKGDKVVMLSIAYPEESDDEYDVSFDGLYADNENMIEAVEAMFTDGDVIDYEILESEYGVKGILYHFTFKQEIGLLTKADGKGYYFCFPSENDRRWFYVVLLHTNDVVGDDYKDDYLRLLSTIREKS